MGVGSKGAQEKGFGVRIFANDGSIPVFAASVYLLIVDTGEELLHADRLTQMQGAHAAIIAEPAGL